MNLIKELLQGYESAKKLARSFFSQKLASSIPTYNIALMHHLHVISVSGPSCLYSS